MSPEQEPDLDARMRQALAAQVPADEPPIGLRVDEVMRLGRRRARVRRVVPVAAVAVVTALAVAVPWTIATNPAPVPDLPLGGTTTSARPAPTSDGTPAPPSSASATTPGGPTRGSATGSAPGTETSPPATTEPEFRVPAGHVRGKDADALAKTVADRQPAAHVAAYFGTNSAVPAGGGRYGFGFHLLWQDGGRYGYLAMLHRTKGDFPASVYGMPAEPCLTDATRLPEYHCTPVTVPAGDIAYSYEITNGYRVRGVVWDKKDPAGGADLRITGAFFLPEPGGWTPFSELDRGPLLESIPLTTADLATMVGIPT